MTSLGYQPGPIDGQFGKATERGLSAFQKQAGLAPDGRPRPSVMRALRARTQTVQVAQTNPNNALVLGGSAGQPPRSSVALGPSGGVVQPTQTVSATPDKIFDALMLRYVAANPDLISDPEFISGWANRGCLAPAQQAAANPILAQQYLVIVQSELLQVLAQANAAPAVTYETKITFRAALGNYDLSTQMWELGDNLQKATIEGPQWCQSFRAADKYPTRFFLEEAPGDLLESSDVIEIVGGLPMDRATAALFFERKGRGIDLELNVIIAPRVPPRLAGGRLFGRQGGLAIASIKNAKAVDPDSGEVLHTYDPSLFGLNDPVVAGLSFDSILDAFLAHQPDIAKDEAFAQAYGARVPQGTSCQAFDSANGNEFQRAEFFQQYTPQAIERLRQDVATAQGTQASIYQGRTKGVALGEYDIGRGAFSFPNVDEINPFYFGIAGTFNDSRASCLQVSSSLPRSFIIDKIGKPVIIKEVPVAFKAARDLVEAKGPRSIDFVYEVAIEGFGTSPSLRRPAALVRVISLAAVHRDTGEVLHDFEIATPTATGDLPDLPASPDLPTHADLLALLVRETPEILDDLAFAMGHLYRQDHPELCKAVSSADEFRRRELLQEAPGLLRAEFANLTTSGTRFTLRQPAELGEFDFESELFPVRLRPGSPGFDAYSEGTLRISTKATHRVCGSPSREKTNYPEFFFVVGRYPEAPESVPVPLAGASRFVDQYGRTLVLETVFQIDGFASQDRENVTASPRARWDATASILSARILHPDTGEIVHSFSVELPANEVAGAQEPQDPWAPYPAPEYSDLLLALVNRDPELAQRPSYVLAYAGTLDCQALTSTQGNEFARSDVIDEYGQKLLTDLAAFEPGATVVLSLQQILGKYDTEQGRFSLDSTTNLGLRPGREASFLATSLGCYSAPGGRDTSGPPISFNILLENADRLMEIGAPLNPSVARAYIDRGNVPSSRRRDIALQLLVELAAPEPPVGQGSRLASLVPGRVIDARLKDPFTEEVIHSYGAQVFDAAVTPEPSSRSDPWESIPEGGFDELLVTLARQTPGAGSDPTFQLAYASERACEDIREVAGNDFAIARIAKGLQPEFAERIAAVAASETALVRFSYQQALGAYDFDKQAYTYALTSSWPEELLSRRGRDLLQPNCSYTRQRYPVTRFIINFEGQNVILEAGVPMAPEAAEAMINRLDRNRRVGLDLLALVELPASQDSRYEGDRSVTAQIVDARIVALDSGEILHLYGPSVFGANVQAAYYLVSNGSLSAGQTALHLAGSGLSDADLNAIGDAMGIKIGSEIPQAEGQASVQLGIGAVIASADQFQQLFATNSDIDYDVEAILVPGIGSAKTETRLALGSESATTEQKRRAIPPAETEAADAENVEDVRNVSLQTPSTVNEIPAASVIADPAKLTVPSQDPADTRTANEFQILNVTVGMTEAEILAAIAEEFLPDQIATDSVGGTIFAERGACNYADPTDPSIVAEVGSFCLAVRLTDGAATRVALRQVIPGDVSAPAFTAFTERYGLSVPDTSSQNNGDAIQTITSWGRLTGTDRISLGRSAGVAPAHVLESDISISDGVTVLVLRLDLARPEAPAPSAAIKF